MENCISRRLVKESPLVSHELISKNLTFATFQRTFHGGHGGPGAHVMVSVVEDQVTTTELEDAQNNRMEELHAHLHQIMILHHAQIMLLVEVIFPEKMK
jgi:hypothetical protein